MSDHENYRNEIKAYIVRAGMTMSEVVEVLAEPVETTCGLWPDR